MVKEVSLVEKKKLKEEIKKTLKSYALSKDLLAKSLNLNIEDIEDALDSLILSGEIKWKGVKGLYKLCGAMQQKSANDSMDLYGL